MPDGLSNEIEIEALADAISAAADALHQSLMRDLKAGRIGQDTARTLFDNELVLRQRANGLYADAATYVVKGLGRSQQQVLDLAAAATGKLRTIARIERALGLAAGLAGLAGAIASGQPAPIVLALEKIHHALDAGAAPA